MRTGLPYKFPGDCVFESQLPREGRNIGSHTPSGSDLHVVCLHNIFRESQVIDFNSLESVLCSVSHVHPTLCDPIDCNLPGSSGLGDSSGKNTGVGCHAFLEGIFPTQGLNSALLHCRWILYWLSHQRSQILFLIFAFSGFISQSLLLLFWPSCYTAPKTGESVWVYNIQEET